MSSFDSQASRVNFWKDINTRDELYAGAIVISKDDGGDQSIKEVKNKPDANEERPKKSKSVPRVQSDEQDQVLGAGFSGNLEKNQQALLI